MIRLVASNGFSGPLHGARTAHNRGAYLTARGRKHAAVGRHQKQSRLILPLHSVDARAATHSLMIAPREEPRVCVDVRPLHVFMVPSSGFVFLLLGAGGRARGRPGL